MKTQEDILAAYMSELGHFTYMWGTLEATLYLTCVSISQQVGGLQKLRNKIPDLTNYIREHYQGRVRNVPALMDAVEFINKRRVDVTHSTVVGIDGEVIKLLRLKFAGDTYCEERVTITVPDLQSATKMISAALVHMKAFSDEHADFVASALYSANRNANQS